MRWNETYWALQNQYYWSPVLIGLDSMKAKRCIQENGNLLLPLDRVRTDGSIYWRFRDHDAAATHERLHGSEVVLNHFFNIMTAIAPDDVLRRLLLEPLGFTQAESVLPFERELWRRYGWSESANITLPDGFFHGPDTVVAVELKLDARTDAGQVLKYAALLAMEERLSGQKERLGLLYIVPEKHRPKLWQKLGLAGPQIDRAYLRHAGLIKPGNAVSRFISENKELMASVLDRMQLQAISWSDVLALMRKIDGELDPHHRGDQTLHRLLAGFIAQLEAHRKTGI